MKKFILVLFAAAVVCSLVACSNKSSEESNSTSDNIVAVENLTGNKDDNIKDTWIIAAGRTGVYIDVLEPIEDEYESVSNIIKYASAAKEEGYDAYSFIATKYEEDQTSYAFYAVNTNLYSQPDAIVIVAVKEDGTVNIAEFTDDKSEIFGSYAPTDTEETEEVEDIEAETTD